MAAADISARSSLLTELAYQDYIVMICSMDAEWSRKRFTSNSRSTITKKEKEGFLRNQRDFTASCRKYRDGIVDNFVKFRAANHSRENDSVADFIFSPIYYFPLGKADDLSIVLLDDFDSVHRLTADIATSVAEVCIGFCPSSGSIAQSTSQTFWDLHQLLQMNRKHKVGLEEHMHAFQREAPLLVFTKFKLNGLATLGHGLCFQQAILKTMAVKVRGVVADLQQRYDDDSTLRRLIQRTDIDNMKYSFLDLQGQEEIGTLCFCSNYSVGVLLVSTLRSMTFDDVFKVNSSVRELFSRSAICQKLAGGTVPPGPKAATGCAIAITDSFVFSWTRTTLGVASGALFNPADYPCNGLVETVSKVQISPGHQLAVEQRFKTDPKDVSQKPLDPKSYHRCHVGTEDLYFTYGRDGRSSLMPLTSTLDLIRANVLTFRTRRTDGDHGRNLVDFVTSMTIPVPKMRKGASDLACRQVAARHRPLLMNDLLKNIHTGLFKVNPNRQKGRLDPGRLDLRLLTKTHRRLGVPVSLRRTIENLYQDFAIIIRDPFLFEAVIDLYDAFATLHRLLTEDLPRIRGRERADTRCLGYLEDNRVLQLSLFVEALNNALMHRVSRLYPETHIREMCVDFRGSVNQILLSADAAVKCGLGLVRKYSGNNTHRNRDARATVPRDTVGCVTRIGFTPGARCYSLQFGLNQSTKLAFLDVDISHILHPASYCDNMHEAFHLAFTPPGVKDSPYREIYDTMEMAMKDRVGDIFAGLLTKAFLFASDTDAFIFDHIGSYSKSSTSVGVDDAETVARFVDVLIRLFMTHDVVPDHQKVPCDNQCVPGGESLKEGFQRFKSMIGRFGPYFSEYDRLWGGMNSNRIMSFCRSQFYRIYPQLTRMMPYVKDQTDRVIAKHKKDLCWERNPSCPFNMNDEHIRNCVQSGFKEGRPITRAMCGGLHRKDSRCPERDSPAGNEEMGMDLLVVTSAVLGTYVSRVKQGKDLAIHLVRKPDTKNIDHTLPAGYKKWHDFLFDKGAASMFCAVPSERRARLRRQIVILKTLWDVSSCLRARRLNEIITNNLLAKPL